MTAMFRFKLALCLGAALAPMAMLAPIAARAQAPSPGQITPRSLAPPAQTTPSGVVLPEAQGGQAPAGAERITLRVGDVVVEGGDPALARETDAVIAAIRGRSITIAEAYAAAAAIEKAYAARGYFLTRVVIPPQTARHGGPLRLRVVEGFVESVDASALPAETRARVEAVVAALVGERRLPLSEFERRLLIAGDTPGLALRSTLTPGRDTGAVRLVLVGDYRPASAVLSADNSLPSSLGRTSLTLSTALQSVLGTGELIYATASGAPREGFLASEGPRRLFAAGFIAPIGPSGLTFNAEGALSSTHPRIRAGALQTDSDLQRLSFRFAYPVIRTRLSSLTLRAALDIVDEKQRAPLFDAILYDDRVRPIRLGFDWSQVAPDTGTLLNASADFSQGISWLGARGRADATIDRPISRAHADDVFSKIEGRARIAQPLPFGLTLELSGRGQYSFSGPLLNSERFTLGGPGGLSALDAGAIAGDHGWLARGELQYAIAVPQNPAASGVATPYVFASHGQAFTEQPSAVERRVVNATNVGLGARAVIWPTLASANMRPFDLGVEIARQFADSGTARGWRVNASAAVRF